MLAPLAKKPVAAFALCALLAAAVGAGGMWLAMRGSPSRKHSSALQANPSVQVADPARLRIENTSIEIPRKIAELNHMAIAVAQLPTRDRQLTLRGSLAIDSGKLVHVRARFPGEIVDVASIAEPADPPQQPATTNRPLRFMDRVTKEQPMAILWSKDLGEKKSELVDALARLRLDRQALGRIQEAAERGAVSEKGLREAERQVQVGEIAVSRAERTLRSWQITEKEIAQVEAEVDRIEHHEADQHLEDAAWARVVIPAPIDGTIVEKNFTIGDLVDTTSDLFKIADLSQLAVWLHAYEEDLPYLERMPKPIAITIRLPSNPEIPSMPGLIESIGDIIDPTEHMALLVGHVENVHGELRAGQFVTAAVALPPEEGVVEIPTRALVEDGTESLVFVQETPEEYRFKPRRVSVARRNVDVVLVRSHLTPQQQARGLEELHEGERVAASETVQLKAAILQKMLTTATGPSEPAPAQP